jgi:hypothetical protein
LALAPVEILLGGSPPLRYPPWPERSRSASGLPTQTIDHRLKRWPVIVGSGVAGLNAFSRDVPAFGDEISRNLPALIGD